MKQKDIALILVIIIVSGMASFFVARLLFAGADKRMVKAEVVDPISDSFEQPKPQYFNATSINPTLQIQIGNDVNKNPFINGQQ